jgi:uncharacterized membrane protein YkvI
MFEERDMTISEFETDRRGLIGGTLGALIIGVASSGAAASAVGAPTTLRKASLPRGSYGIASQASSAPPSSTPQRA